MIEFHPVFNDVTYDIMWWEADATAAEIAEEFGIPLEDVLELGRDRPVEIAGAEEIFFTIEPENWVVFKEDYNV